MAKRTHKKGAKKAMHKGEGKKHSRRARKRAR
jgi:hypothetical protein